MLPNSSEQESFFYHINDLATPINLINNAACYAKGLYCLIHLCSTTKRLGVKISEEVAADVCQSGAFPLVHQSN